MCSEKSKFRYFTRLTGMDHHGCTVVGVRVMASVVVGAGWIWYWRVAQPHVGR